MASDRVSALPVETSLPASLPVSAAQSSAPEEISAPSMVEAPPLPAVPIPKADPPPRAKLAMVDGYVLRSALTRAPVPLAEVEPRWPDGLAPNEAQSGRFTLFIDEAGTVDRVVPDGPSLFPSLQESAIAAFSAAQFEPGEVDGRRVKSVIRIEVVFDPRATKVPGAVVRSQRNL